MASISTTTSLLRQRCRYSMLSQLLLLQLCLLVTVCAMFVQITSAKHLADVTGAAMGDTAEVAEVAIRGQHQHHQHHQQLQQNYQHSRRRLQRDFGSKNLNAHEQCEAVRSYFESIDIKPSEAHEGKGSICAGSCCSNSTEIELTQKARNDFVRLLHHHTKSLRGILESTANLFQSHIIELAEQSQNKTLNVFSQVYRRMVPLSRKLIHQLYAEIINHLKSFKTNPTSQNANQKSLEDAIHTFFENLFPVAYHQAVHLNKNNNGELHEHYIDCLKHNYDDLQPFGTIPKEIKHNLIQSVQTASIFMNSLQQSAEVLSEADELYDTHLTDTCQKQLLKMNYCPSCNGLMKPQVKPCYSYCMNVLRGCSAEYAGVLDSTWSNVVDAITKLVATHIDSDSGIVLTIKQLDGKLSDTIMRSMENGPELERKVTKTCGVPKLMPTQDSETEIRLVPPHNIKWATPTDAEILRYLSTIDKSKEFFSNIVANACEDEDIQHNNHNCWTGDRIGDYTQTVMASGVDTQRYNPEVPLEQSSQTTKLNALVDKLIKIRKNIASAIPSSTKTYSDIQGDMARHDEEGSGRMTDDADDEDFGGSINGSGDGSGDGATSTSFNPMSPTDISSNDIEQRSAATFLSAQHLSVYVTTALLLLVTINLLSNRNYLLLSQ